MAKRKRYGALPARHFLNAKRRVREVRASIKSFQRAMTSGDCQEAFTSLLRAERTATTMMVDKAYSEGMARGSPGTLKRLKGMRSKFGTKCVRKVKG